MIKGVNDGRDNLYATAQLLKDAKNLLRVEILPYNGAAGAKYEMTGMVYGQDFVAPKKDEIDLSPFTESGIECRIM
jgi:pyruvate formate lyase activating enzyme